VVRKSNDTDFLSMHADTDGWASAYGWWSTTAHSENTQILDLIVVDDLFVGVGSQINTPPAVFLPPQTWTFASDPDGDGVLENMFETVQLVSGFDAYDGECWEVDGNDDGLAVVCVNQDADEGRIYTIGADWASTAYDPSSWTATNTEDIVAAATVDGHSTWNEGVCRGADNEVTVVGRDSQTDDGYVIRSTDGGSTWTEHTADIVAAYGGAFGPATRCMYTDTHLLIGGSGIYAHVALSDL
jgi:hypothetical protein